MSYRKSPAHLLMSYTLTFLNVHRNFAEFYLYLKSSFFVCETNQITVQSVHRKCYFIFLLHICMTLFMFLRFFLI